MMSSPNGSCYAADRVANRIASGLNTGSPSSTGAGESANYAPRAGRVCDGTGSSIRLGVIRAE
jgi:hypothetical protein